MGKEKENRNGKTKGNAIALMPIGVFLVLYLGLGILFEYVMKIPMGFYNVPIVVAFLAAILVACLQNRAVNFEQKLEIMSGGGGDKNIITMLLITIAGFLICSVGLQNGVERVTKVMMIVLMVVMIFLAVYSFTMPGAKEGLKFYLVPDKQQIEQVGLFHIITSAMSQAFFTLSLGIGAMLIFGSYLNGGKSLLGEAVNIAVLDTFVAITAGLIIFPACFSYHVQPDSGPKLIFMTLPHIFTSMKGGRIFGSFFFLFLFFAALSTIIAVFENIMCCFSEIFGVSRKQSAVINCILIILGSLPCALGYNVWSGFQPLGAGSTVLDLEDFIVSNLLLPVGSLIYLLFCTSKWGWGFKNYQAEASKGDGLKVPDWMRLYLTYILPLLLLVLIVQGLIG